MFKKLNCKLDNVIIKKIIASSKYIKKQACELYGSPSETGYLAESEDDQKVIDYYKNNVFSSFIHYSFPVKSFIDYLPSSFLQKEKPTINWQVISGGKSLPPHVDLQRKCAVNFYLECDNETTIFYKRKRQGVFLREINNKYTSNELFVPEWLDQVDHFIANKHELYLIDTTVPHSVESSKEQTRISISFSYYKTTFEELLSCLKSSI